VSDLFEPNDEEQLAEAIAQAVSSQTPVEVCGAGTKRGIGRPLQTAARLSTEKLTGITLYEPSELVLSARAGTPLCEIESALAKNNQELAFEPVDLGPMLGQDADLGTIGAVFAANLSGSRRIQAGAARDHFLGMRAVSGRGEIFKSGGRVMKNVTGYDLCRGVAGSWGTLAVMSEVTMKVLPKAQATASLLFLGLTDQVAVDAMCAAMGTPFEVSGAVHLHKDFAKQLVDSDIMRRPSTVTALRLENFKTSIDYRVGRLADALSAFGKIIELDNAGSEAFWGGMRTLSFLSKSDNPVWRISTAPGNGAKLVSALTKRLNCHAAYDWSGGLIWLQSAPTSDAGASEIRRVVAEIGGYATLIRADAGLRASVDVFQPLAPGVAALTAKLKESFDPSRVLNPGRMYSGV
jgi:glycolate oxidase FAD binding subunit